MQNGNNGIFVRPNLKGFLIGGILVMVFHVVMQQIEGISIASARPEVPPSVRQWNEADFQVMINHVADKPSAEGYYKLGAYLQHKRDFKRAMLFVRKAEAFNRALEEDTD
jgi:hypothetical protein